MSRKGNCWDIAVAENLFKTLKVEFVYQNRFKNKHEAESSISEYFEKFYNTNRRHRLQVEREDSEDNKPIILKNRN